MELPSWASEDVDIEHPSPARVYDYYLGGSHNFAVDRKMARQAIELWLHIELYRRAGAPMTMRSLAEIERLLDGFDLIPPGVVFMPLWRPDSPIDVDDHLERFTGYAVVGRRA